MNAPNFRRHNHVAKAMDYILKRWDAFPASSRTDEICLSNNAAERAIRGLALGRNHGCSSAPIAAESAPR